MGQEGTYVDIPGGSRMYVYGARDSITNAGLGGWHPGSFAGMLMATAFECTDDVQYLDDIEEALKEHFLDYEEEAEESDEERFMRQFEAAFRMNSPTLPEWGEMLCQTLDRRVSQAELRPDLHRGVRQTCTAKFGECKFCGTETRIDASPLDPEDAYCDDNECHDRSRAELYGLTYEQYKNLDRRQSEEDLTSEEFVDIAMEMGDGDV